MILKYFLFSLFIVVTMSACAPQKGDKGDAIVGPAGSQGNSGPKGEQGDQGAAGNDGVNGQNGLDASPTTIVKLCSGFTQYNSTFVEVALCIQGRLYGVYSANGGFMTEIVPGTYTSEGINNSCTLIVGSNCSVSW